MAWRIVIQPNGRYAKFSDVVDNFTDYDMTRDEAFELCRDAAGVSVAEYKLRQAELDPKRFERELQRIRDTHGDSEAESVRNQLSTPHHMLAVEPFRMQDGFVVDANGSRVLVCFNEDDPELIAHCDRKYSEALIDADLCFVCPCGRIGQRMEDCPPHRCEIAGS